MNLTQNKILLVEDDPNLGILLKDFLELKNFMVVLIADGKSALEILTKDNFDMCIFDVMLPSLDGFTLAQSFRGFNKTTPVIFLTAKSMQQDKIEGLKIGADDYIVKPFNTEELLLRINAVLRRSKPTILEQKFSEHGIDFDFIQQTLKVDNLSFRLSSKENELLYILLQNKNSLVERNVILNKIWKDDSYFASRSMDVYISKLRNYLKNSSIEIINVHGKGFKLLTKE